MIQADGLGIKNTKKEKDPTYVFVSRVVRMKGIEEIIKAFSFIARAKVQSKLWIVGGGQDSYITELKHMMADYGIGERVTFFGNVSEQRKYELMSRAHLLLHASVKEGWGLVVLEAASVGTPAIVYNVTGLKDVVKNGETGLVISDNSPSEMAREAMKLFSDGKTYALYSKNGRQWAKSLRWPDAVKQSLRILDHAQHL
jgi:glycosyltransferase involved in cell wall biosynthesis